MALKPTLFQKCFLFYSINNKILSGLVIGFFRVLNESFWTELDSLGENKFDVVSCLNVLDRCDTPLSMLNNIGKVLGPEGLVVVAFVIPFKPFVEFGRCKIVISRTGDMLYSYEND